MKTLQEHLAGASDAIATLAKGEGAENREKEDAAKLFVEAVALHTSEMLGAEASEGHSLELKKLGSKHIKIRVRERLTVDGGRSIVAA